jgi:hypothetical protein
MDSTEKAAEPPSCLRPPIFMIGQDSRGNWVAQEQNGVCGGLFVDRAGALKFAKSENGNHPHTVVWVSGVLELDISRAPAIAAEQWPAERVRRERRFA